MDLQLVGGAYEGRGSAASAQICVNWMVESLRDESDKRSLIGTPGLVQQGSGSFGTRIRGMHVFGEELYVVADASLYRIDRFGVSEIVGTLDSTEGVVSMTDNGRDRGGQMVISDGNDLYYYDPTLFAPLLKNFDEIFAGSGIVTFLDGYVLFNRPDTSNYYASLLNDASALLGFASAEGSPDNLVSVLADHRELWLFGTESTEVHFNSGNVDFPFERFQGGFTHQGCAAAHSPARIDNSIMWLAQNDRGQAQIVQATGGYRAQVVSPQQINRAIDRMGRIDDAIAFAYQTEGHECYHITFPSGNRTFVYDALEKEWHERASQLGDGVNGRHLVEHHAFAYGKHYVGSYDGRIFEMSHDYFDDAGERIIRERVGKHVRSELTEISFSEIELLFETGQGNYDSPDPIAELAHSKDRGHTWSAFRTRRVGAAGEHLRAVWRKNGRARDWTFKVRVSDKIRWVLVGAYGR